MSCDYDDEDDPEATECDACGVERSEDEPIFWFNDGYYCTDCAYG